MQPKRVFVENRDRCERLAAYLKKSPPPLMAVDLETTGLNLQTDNIVGVSMCWDEKGPAAWISLKVIPDALDILKPSLESIPLVNHNALGFDLPMLKRAGVNARYEHDTLILAYATGYWAEGFGKLGLKDLSKDVLDYQQITYAELFEKLGLAGQTDFSLLPQDHELVLQYTTDDPWCSLRLYNKLVGDPRKGVKVIYDLERKLAPISNAIQAEGVTLDLPYLKSQAVRLRQNAAAIEHWLKCSAGLSSTFNLSSGDQLAKLLYTDWKLPVLALTGQKKPKHGETVAAPKNRKKPPRPATDEGVINQLIHQHGGTARTGLTGRRFLVGEWLENLLVLKAIEKNEGTYVEGLPALADAAGILRTVYHQFGTSSGRFSSSNPNLQNLTRFVKWIPAGELFDMLGTITFDIRRAFVAGEDHYFLDSDYNAIEARIMASASGDPNYLRVFTSGGDIHTNTAAIIHDCQPEEVTKEQRQASKTCMYGWSYGQGLAGLAKRNDLTEATVRRLMRKLKTAFQAMCNWREDVIAEWYRRKGWAYSYFGRPHYLPHFKDRDKGIRAAGERIAFNHYVQGTAADIQKMSLLRLYKSLSEHYQDRAKIVMHTHDSNTIRVHKSIDPKEIIPLVQAAMMIRIPGWLPFKVDSQVKQHLGGEK